MDRARAVDSTKQRICNQARAIRKNGWLSDAEVEVIRVKTENDDNGEDEKE